MVRIWSKNLKPYYCWMLSFSVLLRCKLRVTTEKKFACLCLRSSSSHHCKGDSTSLWQCCDLIPDLLFIINSDKSGVATTTISASILAFALPLALWDFAAGLLASLSRGAGLAVAAGLGHAGPGLMTVRDGPAASIGSSLSDTSKYLCLRQSSWLARSTSSVHIPVQIWSQSTKGLASFSLQVLGFLHPLDHLHPLRHHHHRHLDLENPCRPSCCWCC